MSSASPSAIIIIILFCHSCLGGSGSRLLSFHLFTFSFWQHLFVFFFLLARFLRNVLSGAIGQSLARIIPYFVRNMRYASTTSAIFRRLFHHLDIQMVRCCDKEMTDVYVRHCEISSRSCHCRNCELWIWWPSIKCGRQFSVGWRNVAAIVCYFHFLMQSFYSSGIRWITFREIILFVRHSVIYTSDQRIRQFPWSAAAFTSPGEWK